LEASRTQIQQRILELRGVRVARPQIRRRLDRDLDHFSQCALEEGSHVLEERSHVGRGGPQLLLAGERQQTLGQLGAAFRRDGRLVGELVQVAPGLELLLQQLEIAEDHRQQVVEIVRHATRQLSEGFQLLGVAQFLLDAHPGLDLFAQLSIRVEQLLVLLAQTPLTVLELRLSGQRLCSQIRFDAMAPPVAHRHRDDEQSRCSGDQREWREAQARSIVEHRDEHAGHRDRRQQRLQLLGARLGFRCGLCGFVDVFELILLEGRPIDEAETGQIECIDRIDRRITQAENAVGGDEVRHCEREDSGDDQRRHQAAPAPAVERDGDQTEQQGGGVEDLVGDGGHRYERIIGPLEGVVEEDQVGDQDDRDDDAQVSDLYELDTQRCGARAVVPETRDEEEGHAQHAEIGDRRHRGIDACGFVDCPRDASETVGQGAEAEAEPGPAFVVRQTPGAEEALEGRRQGRDDEAAVDPGVEPLSLADQERQRAARDERADRDQRQRTLMSHCGGAR
jgi:hypothetical protein